MYYSHEQLHVNNIDSVKSIEEILTSIENMCKPSLIDLLISHGVKFLDKMSSDHFFKKISEHLCNACCLYSTFEGCIQVTSTLNNDFTLPSENKFEEDNLNTLLINILSYLLPKIKLRPLRRLLTQHKIVFSLQDGLSSLRRKLKTFIKTLKKAKSQCEKKKNTLAKEIETNEEIKAQRSNIPKSLQISRS